MDEDRRPRNFDNSLTVVTGVFNISWHFDWIFLILSLGRLRLRSSEFTSDPRNSICWEGTNTDFR